MDDMDARILKALQENARLKQSDLAKDLGVAQSTLLERVRRLEENGFIRGYRALIDAEKIGLQVQAFITLVLHRHDADVIRAFEESLNAIPNIRACYHLTGRFDYLLHVGVSDLKALGDLIKTKIARLPGVGTSETFVVFSEVKPDAAWPMESNNASNSEKK